VAYGSGFNMQGNRVEDCNTGYRFGLDSAGTNQGMSGFSGPTGSAEGCLTFIHLAGTCVGGFVGPIGLLGHLTAGVHENTTSNYGLRVDADCAQACTFYGVAPQSFFDTACISIANATSRGNNVFISCSAGIVGGGGVNWITPTNAYTAKFSQCNVQPVWTYSQLPTGGSVLEGDEFDISDGNSATWGANVTAGGSSNRALVRWNGTNWTVVGK
jgi:hypothetical protein